MLFDRTGSHVLCSGITKVIIIIDCIYTKVLPLSLPI